VRSSASQHGSAAPGAGRPARAEIPALRRRLLAWYRRHRRALPWRRDRDPYRIWISEIMLQQTRVDVVQPYFERFMHRFPDLATLADAAPDDVLLAWAGLGYYSRARHLHAAAQQIVREDGGAFPAGPARIAALPGIGRYTAGAIRSIAFGQQAPILDGNVVRVFARLFGLDGDVEGAATRAMLWDLAADWARCRAPGDANQALMELGALVCTKPAPDCARCPLERACVARTSDRVHELPRPRRRPASQQELLLGAVVHRQGTLLLVRRQSGRLLRDWWEIPTCNAAPDNRAPRDAGARRLSDVLRARLGIGVQKAERLGVVQHGILTRRLVVTLLGATAVVAARQRDSASPRQRQRVDARPRPHHAGRGSAPASAHNGRPGLANLGSEELEMRWADAAACRRLPLSTLTRKALRVAAAHDARWQPFLPRPAAPGPRPALSATRIRAPSARRSSRRDT
jgi:A/G-specific adenine glycosylase